jgi:hypothetical protein
MGLLDFLGLGKPSHPRAPAPVTAAAPAPTPPAPPDAARSEEQLRAQAGVAMDAYVADLVRETEPSGIIPAQRRFEVPTASSIVNAPLEERVRMLELARERSAPDSGEGWPPAAAVAVSHFFDVLLRDRLPLPAEQLLPFIESAGRPPRAHVPEPRILALVSAVRTAWRQPGVPERLTPALEALGKRLRAQSPLYERQQAVEAIRTLLTGSPLPPDWSERVTRAVEEMEAGRGLRWQALAGQLHRATATAPSGRWLKEARRLRAEVGAEEFRATLLEWLPWAREDADYPLSPRSGDLARGFAWLLADGGGAAEARSIGDVALLAAQVVPGTGLRSPKLLSACLASLGGMDTDEAMAQLSRVRARARHAQARRLVEAALRAAAARRGMEPEELEEIVVPTFGMEEPGVLRETFGDWTAELRITGTAEVETAWVRADGKRQKSVPAEVKADHADEAKEVKGTAAEMEKMLAAQRDRLEALPMAGRVVPFPAWRERYLDHPLLALLSRRLVWRFETDGRGASGAWLDGRLVGPDDAPLEGLGEETVVRPWHPVHATTEEVGAWRAWLDRHGVTQPFKQAHREIYVLTEAERATRLYSNRFAGHFLKQHQFTALARGRGWRHHPILWGRYAEEFPSLRLGRYRLVAEYLMAGVENAGNYAGAMTSYVSTDQVRFQDFDRQPVALQDVPPLVLSEVFRDVDLFVGVASVAADPEWPEREYENVQAVYWRAQAFGELAETAVTRREVLQRLLPRLRIAGACSLDDRFLVVRGQRRTYRIHLGSGNVLMEPNGQYLCIVAAGGVRDPAAGVVLPFEGDSMLSVILSKAFFLADDANITDRGILAQIIPR